MASTGYETTQKLLNLLGFELDPRSQNHEKLKNSAADRESVLI